jgi:hypothetical protein
MHGEEDASYLSMTNGGKVIQPSEDWLVLFIMTLGHKQFFQSFSNRF